MDGLLGSKDILTTLIFSRYLSAKSKPNRHPIALRPTKLIQTNCSPCNASHLCDWYSAWLHSVRPEYPFPPSPPPCTMTAKLCRLTFTRTGPRLPGMNSCTFCPPCPPRAAAHRQAVVRQSWLSGCFLPGGPDAWEGRGGKWTTQATMVTGRGFEAEQVCVK